MRKSNIIINIKYYKINTKSRQGGINMAEFGIRFPELEVSYICLHIKGAKHERVRWDSREALSIENRELQYLVNEMIDAFDPMQACLLKQDEEFIQGLLAHLQPTLIRIMYGMHIQNPMLGEIRESYPEIYRKCGNVAAVLKKKTQREVPEEETGFLTVHFGAAVFRLEGRKESIRKVHVGVICSSGIGISRLMVSKLEKTYNEMTDYEKSFVASDNVKKLNQYIERLKEVRAAAGETEGNGDGEGGDGEDGDAEKPGTEEVEGA